MTSYREFNEAKALALIPALRGLLPVEDRHFPVREDCRDRAVPHMKTIVPAFPRDLFTHGAVRRVPHDLIDPGNRHQVVPVHPERPAEVLRTAAVLSRAESP